MEQFSLEKYLANPSRKVVTRDGRKVTRILCTDARGKYPIVALIEIAGEERVYSFIKNGCWDTNGGESVNDLFFAPEKREGWINVYRNSDGGHTYAGAVYDSQEDAEKHKVIDENCVTTIKIEWEE